MSAHADPVVLQVECGSCFSQVHVPASFLDRLLANRIFTCPSCNREQALHLDDHAVAGLRQQAAQIVRAHAAALAGRNEAAAAAPAPPPPQQQQQQQHRAPPMTAAERQAHQQQLLRQLASAVSSQAQQAQAQAQAQAQQQQQQALFEQQRQHAQLNAHLDVDEQLEQLLPPLHEAPPRPGGAPGGRGEPEWVWQVRQQLMSHGADSEVGAAILRWAQRQGGHVRQELLKMLHAHAQEVAKQQPQREAERGPRPAAGGGGAAPAANGRERDADDADGDDDDGGAEGGGETFVEYRPAKLGFGAPHPDPVVEAASLAAVEPPDVTYVLAAEAQLRRALSALQLEAVVYACQRHEARLPGAAAPRAGFLIGDGAGVGKGRAIAGLVVEGWAAGRRRHLWLSVASDLKVEARRDLDDVGAHDVPVHALNKLPYGPLDAPKVGVAEGVLFATYSSLVASSGRRTRLRQVVDWLAGGGGGRTAKGRAAAAAGFGGLVVFDECHKAKNLYPASKAGAGGAAEAPSTRAGTRVGRAVAELQDALPGARVVYCSATGASEPRNMGYMTRLGLWGDGHPAFPHFGAFLAAVAPAAGRGGGAAGAAAAASVAALELLAMDMKAQGAYVARTLSYAGAEFAVVAAPLPPAAEAAYRDAAEAWSRVLREFLYAEEQAADAAAALAADADERRARAAARERAAAERLLARRLARLAGPAAADAGVAAKVAARHWKQFEARAKKGSRASDAADGAAAAAAAATSRGGLHWRTFWSAHQTFFRHMCVAAKVPAAVAAARDALAAGKCVVVGLQSTGEARTEAAVAAALRSAGAGEAEFDDFVSGPREVIVRLVKHYYPLPPDPDAEGADGRGGGGESEDEDAARWAARDADLPVAARPPGARAARGAGRPRYREFDEDEEIGLSEDEGGAPAYGEDGGGGGGEGEGDGSGGASGDPGGGSEGGAGAATPDGATTTTPDGASLSTLLEAPTPSSEEGGESSEDEGGRKAARAFRPLGFGRTGGPEDDAFGRDDWAPDAEAAAAAASDEAWWRGRLDAARRARAAAAARRAQVLAVASALELPANPLDALIDALGGPECVAEMTGRKGRLVRDRATGRLAYEPRNASGVPPGSPLEVINVTERAAFMGGAKRVAVISEAASAGISLHADARVANRARRVHLTLELPWAADRAVQQFGRSHRANQASAPQYRLLFTPLGGERRFAAAVARRLESLGALTQGDRRAGPSLGEFNYESGWGASALKEVYAAVLDNGFRAPPAAPPACAPGPGGEPPAFASLDAYAARARQLLLSVGLARPERGATAAELNELLSLPGGVPPGAAAIDERERGDVPRFLNRLLGLAPADQAALFDFFQAVFEAVLARARREGALDEGAQDVRAHSVRLAGAPRALRAPGSGAAGPAALLYAVDLDRGLPWDAAAALLAAAGGLPAQGEGEDAPAAKRPKLGADVKEEPAPAADPAAEPAAEPAGEPAGEPAADPAGDDVVDLTAESDGDGGEVQPLASGFYTARQKAGPSAPVLLALAMPDSEPAAFEVHRPGTGRAKAALPAAELRAKYAPLAPAAARLLWDAAFERAGREGSRARGGCVRRSRVHVLGGAVMQAWGAVTRALAGAPRLRVVRVATTDDPPVRVVGMLVPERAVAAVVAELDGHQEPAPAAPAAGAGDAAPAAGDAAPTAGAAAVAAPE